MPRCQHCDGDLTNITIVVGLDALLVDALHRMENKIMTAISDLNDQLTALATSQTELIKDQGRALGELSALLADANPDLSVARQLVADMQAKNDAADAAIEAVSPEQPTP